jgi:hypothetical protein
MYKSYLEGWQELELCNVVDVVADQSLNFMAVVSEVRPLLFSVDILQLSEHQGVS